MFASCSSHHRGGTRRALQGDAGDEHAALAARAARAQVHPAPHARGRALLVPGYSGGPRGLQAMVVAIAEAESG